MPLSIEADSGFGCTGRSTTAPFFEALETESIQPFPFDRPKPRCYTAQHVENKTHSVADALGVLQQVVIHRQWVRPA
jgi:hypothetical protein